MYPYLTGKCFPFAMGNVSPSHWEKFPPFTFKRFPFLLVNVSFPIGKCFPSHWEEFFLLTGKGFLFPSGRETGKRFHILQGNVSPFQRRISNLPSGKCLYVQLPNGKYSIFLTYCNKNVSPFK